MRSSVATPMRGPPRRYFCALPTQADGRALFGMWDGDQPDYSGAMREPLLPQVPESRVSRALRVERPGVTPRWASILAKRGLFSLYRCILIVSCLTIPASKTREVEMLKKKQTRLFTLTSALVLGLVLAACSTAPSPINRPAPTNTVAPTSTSTSAPAGALNSPLVGTWEGTDVDLGDLTIEFKADGTYEVTASGATFVLTYEIVDADTFLLIDPSGDTDTATVDFVRSGDTLTMTMDGSTLELHLVP